MVVVLVVLFVLARRQRVVCPGDLEAVRAGASFLLRRAEVVQFGPFLSVRGVAGFVPVEFRVHCTSGRYEVRWPWPLGVALLFVPGAAFAALALLVWMAVVVGRFERDMLDLFKAAS